jgi:two-component system, NtrC family, nitrogen regulation response regulator GlnG
MANRARAAIRDALLAHDSREMGQVCDLVEEVAEDDVPVLIEGEPGSGRELVARTIHYAGPRRNAGFVAVKAANIPRALVEGELFAQKGSLRRANGGTLLLKDVDTLPKAPQRGLARVLRKKIQSREESGENVDVRFIGATDGDLVQSVEAEYFDRELYERLGARRIKIPPLRRRADDIPRLVRHFLASIGEELGRGRVSVTDRALTRLARYPWPGNVAELKDVLKRILVRAKRGAIDSPEVEAVLTPLAERIPAEEMAFEEIVRNKLAGFLRRVEGYPVENLYEDVIARVEKPLLALVMEHTGGNQLKAAEILGLNRNTLRKKLVDHGLMLGEGPVRRK